MESLLEIESFLSDS